MKRKGNVKVLVGKQMDEVLLFYHFNPPAVDKVDGVEKKRVFLLFSKFEGHTAHERKHFLLILGGGVWRLTTGWLIIEGVGSESFRRILWADITF